MKIIQKWKLWFTLSLIFILIGVGFMVYRGGLNFGIDFKGGTEVTFNLGNNFNKAKADAIVREYTDDAITNTVNSNEYDVKSAKLTSAQVNEILGKFEKEFNVKSDALVSQNEIGASIGKELTHKALIALAISFICMLIYIAIRFEFKFGVAALIALAHDVLITVSIYAILGITVNSPFIAAILTVIGYSMNDSIVIFDRIRENIKLMRGSSSMEIANTSVNQTMSRSINTSATTLVTIVAVCIFVPTVRTFALPLAVGIAAGAYSSIFIASPIWVLLRDSKIGKKKLVKASHKKNNDRRDPKAIV